MAKRQLGWHEVRAKQSRQNNMESPKQRRDTCLASRELMKRHYFEYLLDETRLAAGSAP